MNFTREQSGSGGTPNVVQNSVSGTDVFTTTSATFVDAGFGVTITPSSSSAKIRVTFPNVQNTPIGAGGYTNSYYTIYRGIAGTNLGHATVGLVTQTIFGNVPNTNSMEIIDAPSTTSPVTYELYVRIDGGYTLRLLDVGGVMLAIAQEVH